MFELLSQVVPGVDVTDIAPSITPTPGNALYLAIGLSIAWLVKSGYLDKFMVWRKEDRNETRKEAQEGLLMVLENTQAALLKCEAALVDATGKLEHAINGKHECEKHLAALTVRVEFLEGKHGIKHDAVAAEAAVNAKINNERKTQ